jgi:hypothetical protein
MEHYFIITSEQCVQVLVIQYLWFQLSVVRHGLKKELED